MLSIVASLLVAVAVFYLARRAQRLRIAADRPTPSNAERVKAGLALLAAGAFAAYIIFGLSLDADAAFLLLAGTGLILVFASLRH